MSFLFNPDAVKQEEIEEEPEFDDLDGIVKAEEYPEVKSELDYYSAETEASEDQKISAEDDNLHLLSTIKDEKIELSMYETGTTRLYDLNKLLSGESSDYLPSTSILPHPDDVKRYKCTYCNKCSFYTNRGLLKHYSTCPHCTEPARWIQNARNAPYLSMGLRVYCPVSGCQKICETFFALMVHFRKHEDLQGAHFACDGCNQYYTNAYHLRDHLMAQTDQSPTSACFNTAVVVGGGEVNLTDEIEEEEEKEEVKMEVEEPVEEEKEEEEVREEVASPPTEKQGPFVNTISKMRIATRMASARLSAIRKAQIEKAPKKEKERDPTTFRNMMNCPVCNITRFGCADLFVHTRYSHPDFHDRIVYGCGGCRQKFTGPIQLRQHMYDEVAVQKRPKCKNSATVYVRCGEEEKILKKLRDYLSKSTKEELRRRIEKKKKDREELRKKMLEYYEKECG